MICWGQLSQSFYYQQLWGDIKKAFVHTVHVRKWLFKVDKHKHCHYLNVQAEWWATFSFAGEQMLDQTKQAGFIVGQ